MLDFLYHKQYNQRRINFLKNSTFVAKHDVRLILGFDFDEKQICEFMLENEAVNMTIWDFLLSFFRIKGKGLYFDQFRFFYEDAPSQYKKNNQTSEKSELSVQIA